MIRCCIVALAFMLWGVTPTYPQNARPHILVFSKTQGIRNPSIPQGLASLRTLGATRNWDVDVTEDARQFTDAALRKYDVVVWLNTSGDVLNPKQQTAYERFHRSGKGSVAVHRGGVDTELEGWPWYRKLASTTIVSKPVFKESTLLNLDHTHPATFMVPFIWRYTDEWFKYSTGALPTTVHPLLAGHDAMYFPEKGHLVSWYREFDGGRYFYTGLGGTAEDYLAGSPFLAHLAGGIEWAAGRAANPVVKTTEGEALILKEFDGASPNGVWEPQRPSPPFEYEVKRDALIMRDSSAISGQNRHLVRRGISIDPRRPYAIEGKLTFPAPMDFANIAYSFCVNMNVAGPDGDLSDINTWSLNVQMWADGKSETRFMGFLDGVFTQIGEKKNTWGEPGVEYGFRVYVNADLYGLPLKKSVSMQVTQGAKTLENFQLDYSAFPYQPDYTKPVRVGFNSHGNKWVLRDLKIYYLDVLAKGS